MILRIATVALLLLCLSLPGCGDLPSSNQTGNSNSEQGTTDTETPDTDTPEEETATVHPEAKYPFQVQAELARVYLRHNILDEALRLYELAIDTQYRQTGTWDAEVWVGFADALARAGRNQEAVNAYNHALRIYVSLFEQNQDPARHNVYVERIAAIHGVLGDRQQQAAWTARLRADENNPDQQIGLAQVHEQLGNADLAEAAWRRAHELLAEDPARQTAVSVALASLLHRTERTDDALTLARGALETEGITSETRRAAMRLLFDIYESRGELDKLEFR